MDFGIDSVDPCISNIRMDTLKLDGATMGRPATLNGLGFSDLEFGVVDVRGVVH